MITLGELLDMASIQDEYVIRMNNGKNVVRIRDVDKIPPELNDYKVVKLYGYNAEGYDGLEVTII